MQLQIESDEIRTQAEMWRSDEAFLGRAPKVSFRLTTFANKKALAKTEHPPTTLRALAREIPKKVARTKDKLPHLQLAIYGDEKSENGSFRHKANLLAVSGIDTDYDGEEVSPEEVRAILMAAAIHALVYTSPSHTAERPRWRVICPFSGEREVSDRRGMVGRLNGLLGGILGGESFRDSQSYTWGRAETIEPKDGGPTRLGVPVVAYVTEGRCIDEADDLDAIADFGNSPEPVNRPVLEARDQSDNEDACEEARQRLEELAAWLACAEDGDRHHTLYVVTHTAGGYLACKRLTREEVETALLEAAAECGLEDAESELLRTIGNGLRDGAERPIPKIDDEDFVEVEEDGEGPDVTDNGESPAPFLASAADLDGLEVPPREWLVPTLVPHRQVTILSGDGGTGKSLLALQLGVATATDREWIGGPVSRPGGVVYISAEDEADELHRRLSAIVDVEGLGWSDLRPLRFRSLAGESAILAALNRKTGALVPTKLFKTLEKAVVEVAPSLVVLDTLADLHSGNQNDQGHARQFVNILRGLAIRQSCAVLLLAHPSLTGLNSGTGTSGSMAWNNSARSRLYLRRVTKAKNGQQEEADPNVRILEGKKSNYGPTGGKIGLRWEAGLFTVDADVIAAADVRRESDGLSKAQLAALKLLNELCAGDGSVSKAEFRKAAISRRCLSKADASTDSHRTAADRGLKALVETGFVIVESGRYRPAEFSSET